MKRFQFFLVVLSVLLVSQLTLGVVVNQSSPGSISGKVTDYNTGQPLQGINVSIFQSEDPNWAGERAWIWVASTFTNENGEYKFTELEPRRYHIHISDGVQDSLGRHYGRADLYHVQVFEGAETPNMNLRLRQAGFIWGYVKTIDGTPIPNATVVANAAWTEGGPDGWHTTITDINGLYKLWLLPSPGEFYPIMVFGGEFNGKTYETKVAPNLYQATLTGTRGPDFLLNEGGKIQGRVVNEVGYGIPGVEIDPQIGLLDDPDTWTDLSGNYTLTSLPVTDNAFAFIDQHEPVVLDGVKYASGKAFVGPFTITPGSVVSAPNMIMLKAGTLEGVVTDENGIPIVGAEVDVLGYDINGYEVNSEEIYTDALGQYTIDYLPPGTYTVRATKDGWMMAKKDDVVITSGSLVDCDLVMKSGALGGTVSGKITNYDEIAPKDNNGNIIPNYCCRSRYGCPNIGLVALPDISYTDQDYIDIQKHFVGFIEAVDDGYDDYFVPSITEIPGEYSFVLPPGNVDVIMFSSEETDDGSYAIIHDYKRLNLIEGSTLTSQDFTAKTTFGTLKGSITVPPDKKFNPQRCVIIAISEDNPLKSPLADAVAFPSLGATYNFKKIPVGTYTLRAVADGFVTQVYEGVIVKEGETTIQDISFVSGGVLSGVITDGTSPIEGVLVKIVENGKSVVTDVDGLYTISGLGTGTYTVLASKPGYGDYLGSVNIVEGQVTTKDIVLTPTVGSIKGKVQLSDGSPVNGARVVAYNATENTYKETSTVGGIFIIPDLIPGDYILAVEVSGYELTTYPSTGYLTLTENEVRDLTSTPIVINPVPPKFSCYSSVSGDTLSIIIRSDVNLLSNPQIAVKQGMGVLDTSAIDYTSNPREFRVTYTIGHNDSIVIIDVTEGPISVIPNNPATASFTFEVSANLVQTASTNITNAIGGEVTMMGTQDNTKVYVPPFALVGTASDSTAVALTIKRYGDPGDPVEGAAGQSVSAVYDFEFEDKNVQIDINHAVTVTMSFEKPKDMSQEEFENTLIIGFFKVQEQRWVYHTEPDSGISNIRINWNNSTIMFDVNHFTKFVILIPAEEIVIGDLDNDSDIDRNDLNILLTYRNQPASACPECDLDGDGIITVLDARKLVLLCTRPRCATESRR